MNIKIEINVNVSNESEIIGIKEDLANYCEKFGDIGHINVLEVI